MIPGIVSTTVEAISVLIWRSISKDGQPSALAHIVNIHQALEPSLLEASFENVVLGTFAEDCSGSGSGSGNGENEELMRVAIHSVDKEYVKNARGRPMGLVDSMARMRELWRDGIRRAYELVRFPLYEDDFEWE
ncbi:hypothetical protein AMTR_s00089p00059440 [Amborella trichopoda]|uniref:Uncharacterized protein n=1 Tax=Amborella trichopoda TaxID=13333 RepID=W1NW10_AMBTC|nr:hypothetical protein AMTR_s00089p00059440 [Amborella trichopoda]